MIVILSSFLIGIFTSVNAEYNEYISDPRHVDELFDDFKNPNIKQSSSGEFNFVFKNPYATSMDNVSLTIDIYQHYTLKTSEDINKDFKNPPIIEKATSQNTDGPVTVGSQTSVIKWKHLKSNSSQPVSLIIKVKSDTPKYGYFIRFELRFYYHYNQTNREFVMRSRGYINDDDWSFALQTGHNFPGNINLTHLGIDGILPDSSFKVLEKKENKGSIPNFESFFLINAILLVLIIIRIRFKLDINNRR